MTDQYRVRALRVDPPTRTAEIEITASNVDSAGMLYIDEQFLLMALRDLVVRSAPASPLHGFAKLEFEPFFQPWANATVSRWIVPEDTTSIPFDKVEVIALQNYPFRGRITSDADAEAYRAKPATATYRITFSNGAYLEGIEEGSAEGSTAIGLDKIDATHKKVDRAKLRALYAESSAAKEAAAQAAFKKLTGIELPLPSPPLAKAPAAKPAKAAKKAAKSTKR